MVLCAPAGPAAVAHFSIARGPLPGMHPGGTGIEAVTLSGLPAATCDGSPVTLVISGNATGNPAAAQSALSTADSALDPCSHHALAVPITIVGGSVTVPLCAGGGTAGYVDVRKLTSLSLTVAGVSVPVGIAVGPSGTTSVTTPAAPPVTSPGTVPVTAPVTPPVTAPGGSTAAGAGQPEAGPPPTVLGETLQPASGGTGHSPEFLAFTGAVIAGLTGTGLAAILAGLSLRLLGRRRVRSATGSNPSSGPGQPPAAGS